MKKDNVLLVEPNFPYPNKSKQGANEIHKNFVPISLLKFGAMHKNRGDQVKLVRGKKTLEEIGFKPNRILVTSLFTYWSKYVWDVIEYYRKTFPESEIWMGGIYATLHSETDKFKELKKRFNIKVHRGVNEEAEKFLPDYTLIPKVEYHATHMMRGCIRRCSFCGTWKIEPKLMHKDVKCISEEILRAGKTKIIFYDNNLLANPNISEILKELPKLKINGKRLSFESQSGIDGRLLEAKPELGPLLKKAGFQNIRIAWDNLIDDRDSIKRQIDILSKAGYALKDTSVFMIYNFDIPYEIMLKKVKNCEKWGVQIIDCRYRPLDLDFDNYNPHLRKGQPAGSFYIHKQSGWTDKKIRDFRITVRQHNIAIRYAKDKKIGYQNEMEKWSAIHNTYKFFSLGSPPQMSSINKNKNIHKKIILLNKLKNYYLRNKLKKPDFKNLKKKEINHKTDFLLKKYDLVN